MNDKRLKNPKQFGGSFLVALLAYVDRNNKRK